MKTYTLTCYQPFGSRCPSAYTIDIEYRGRIVASYSGWNAHRDALRRCMRDGANIRFAAGSV